MYKNHILFSPGVYNVGEKIVLRNMESFGGPQLPVPAVYSVCSVFDEGACDLCGIIPKGDYYRSFQINSNLCRCCFKAEMQSVFRIKKVGKKIKKIFQLQTYKVRNFTS